MRRWIAVSFVATCLACAGDDGQTIDVATPDGRPADGGTIADGATVDATAIDVIPPDVAGRVVNRFGHPMAGIRVAIAGAGETTSDADGRFAFPTVSFPYDLIVLDDGEEQVYLYDELTRSDPTVVVVPSGPVVDEDDLERWATVSGDAIGAFPYGGGSQAAATLRTIDRPYSTPVGQFGDFSFDEVRWHHDDPFATFTVDVHAAVWESGVNNLPSAWHGIGTEAGVMIAHATLVTDVMVALDPVIDTGTIVYTATPPPGFPAPQTSVQMVFDDGSRVSVGGIDGTSLSFSAPLFEGVSFWISMYANDGEGRSVHAWTAGHVAGEIASLDPPAPPEALAPAPSQTGVDTSTVFSWLPYPGLHTIVHRPAVPGTGPTFRVITAEASATIPDVGALGLALPSGIEYLWTVYGVAPIATTDAATDPALAIEVPLAGSEGSSLYRTYVTVP